MIKIERLLQDQRLCRALLGINAKALEQLTSCFESSYKKACIARKTDRQRQIGGGQKGFLPSILDKLIFILVYLKCYPTYDVQGFFFGLERSRTCRWVHQLLPVLESALGYACVLPKRQIRSIEEFMRAFPEIRDVFVDGSERPVQKPHDVKKRRKTYSGKKKQTTRKFLIVCDETRQIGYLSPSKNGRRHDKRLLDKTDIVRHIPDNVTLWADTGFQGIVKQHANTQMPKKATRKKPITLEQKQENKVVSGIRATVEHALSGMKRMGAMVQTYRNRLPNLDDTFAFISAGIWNFHCKFA